MSGASDLAIEGGAPVRDAPLPAWPCYDDEQKEAVWDCLSSGRVNQWTGSVVREFERVFAETMGATHAVAVANGSLALELALRALKIGRGDEVIVTPRSYVASAAAVVLVGARPVFADIDYQTHLMTPETIAPMIGPRTRAIMPVHLNGRPCDMPGIMALAETHGLLVIEDCAQSHGASIDGRRVGTFGDAAAFSFCQDKIISTGGEGGMVLLKDADAWRRAWSFKDHGKDPDLLGNKRRSGGYEYVHSSIGTNMRLTEMQAAIGLAQLRRLQGWTADRTRNALRLARALREFPSVEMAPLPSGHRHAYYRLECSVSPDRLRPDWDRDRMLHAIMAEGVNVLVGTCAEIYLEKGFASYRPKRRRPNAARLGENSLAFLTHPTLDEQAVEDSAAAIRKVFAAATMPRRLRSVREPATMADAVSA